MPILKIFTNLPKSKIPPDFVNKILPVLSRTVKKPEHLFICMVSSDCYLTFGGNSTAPNAVATLESIGNFGVEENKLIAKEVTEFIEKELGIAKDHFLMSFYDKRGRDIAKGGVTRFPAT
ncbi:MIF-like protein mif-2 [Spodoptera frugiperda]|uniref:L-dopachrome isomerase n=1 Tax=Spodoptera frugiperda TaxID=7108 RepID=A0A9R0CY77_SPOFR|nr:MIF-like protein mif-2 [Spodoptera frugiperda]